MMCNGLCKRLTVSFSLRLYCDISVNSFILGNMYLLLLSYQSTNFILFKLYIFNNILNMYMHVFKKIIALYYGKFYIYDVYM